jgi:hypothetical protein
VVRIIYVPELEALNLSGCGCDIKIFQTASPSSLPLSISQNYKYFKLRCLS